MSGCPFLQNLEQNTCPVKHGTIHTKPYPGYVHGTHPEICANGCAPKADQHLQDKKFPAEALIRDAMEYQDLYHSECQLSDDVREARKTAILAEIKETGTYQLTFDELQHGARVSWRNAPKCANRKFWDTIDLLDHRHAKTNEDMFTGCMDLLNRAISCNVTKPFIAMFPHQTGNRVSGPRVWNTQLLRMAAYRMSDGSVLGDPANLEFTEMITRDFGWEAPANKTQFDMLPLVVQINQETKPSLFAIPPTSAPMVPIRHPTNNAFNTLNLMWYAVPAVSCIEVEVGGLTFSGAPFSGWYAVTEIVRDLTDESRYNKLLDIAHAFDLDTSKFSTCWVDEAMALLAKAVLASYSEASLGIVDHHTLINGFWDWYHNEKKTRGYCPGNWKWIIPPMSAAASKCYLGLNKMTEYSLKPILKAAPS